MITFTEKSFKSILNVYKQVDHWFWTRYSINPYNGCQIGCLYCDARSAKYHLPTDFENQIVIKSGAAEQLDQRITRARTLLPDVVGIGGTTDGYQPAERKYRVTRRLLEVLESHHWPTHIFTKSPLVVEDAGLLDRIAQRSWAAVSLTITTTSEPVARFLETRASLPARRFEAIRELKTAAPNLLVGVLFIPITPFLTDDDQNLEAMVRESKAAGADYLLFGGGMTLRDQQAKWYLKHLKATFPALIPKYETLYQFQYQEDQYNGSYGPPPNYSVPIHRKLIELCQAYELPFRIPRYVPQDYRRVNYQVAEQLLNHAWQQQMVGKKAKDVFWAGINIQSLKEDIQEVAARDELRQIRNVQGRIAEGVERLLVRFAQQE